MTNYFVRESDSRSMRPVAWGGPNGLLVVIKEGLDHLPVDQTNLLVLHKMHANKSEPMEWAGEGSNFFTCRHCKIHVNMSNDMFDMICKSISVDNYASFGLDNVTVEYGFLLDEFPTQTPRHGVYVVGYEPEKS